MSNPSYINRRDFLKTTSISVGFLGLQALMTSRLSGQPVGTLPSRAKGFGKLVEQPGGLLSLPEKFSYTTISKTGDIMNDGYAVPGAHDGMAAFPGPDGMTILVRNHELSPADKRGSPFSAQPEAWENLDKSLVYDTAHNRPACGGGTSTLVFNTATQELVSHHLSLVGTIRNCSGGPTPWGSWITCEEEVIRASNQLDKDHGYNFEVPASATPGLVTPVPLEEMGRFNHEAVAVDTKSGIVYQTEDRPDGLIYRFIPNEKGVLANGGKLQALAIKSQPSRDTRNWEKSGQETFPTYQPYAVEWIDLDDPRSPNDDLRVRGFDQGAARFARGEGMFYGNGEIYFACTNGGAKRFGQVFRYRPSPYEGTAREAEHPGTVELFIESQDNQLMQSCDNLTVAPWGDVVICEDYGGDSTLIGITPEGTIYKIGQVQIDSELAGCCFSPDGSTLFVNIQNKPGQTLAITGPWKSRKG